MSSPVKADSLSGLHTILDEVITGLSDKSMCNFQVYSRLQDCINFLQTSCPNHKGVLQARVKWFTWGLERLENYVEANSDKPANEWVMHITYHASRSRNRVWASTETLEHFLKRSYLKDSFPDLYTRLLNLYEKIGLYTEDHETHSTTFKEKVWKLKQNLLEGRL